MTCQDMFAVLVTCPAVVVVVKVGVLSFVCAQRFSAALEILLLLLGFSCKMNSISRQLNVTIASLASCLFSNSWLVSSLLLHVLLAVMNFKLPQIC